MAIVTVNGLTSWLALPPNRSADILVRSHAGPRSGPMFAPRLVGASERGASERKSVSEPTRFTLRRSTLHALFLPGRWLQTGLFPCRGWSPLRFSFRYFKKNFEQQPPKTHPKFPIPRAGIKRPSRQYSIVRNLFTFWPKLSIWTVCISYEYSTNLYD
jgi:hypothetical protein